MSGKNTEQDEIRHIKCELDQEIYDIVWEYRMADKKSVKSVGQAVSELIKKGYKAYKLEKGDSR